MFFNKGAFSNTPFMSSCYIGKNYHKMDISNMIVDEIKIDESLEIKNNIKKEEWDINTVFLAQFQNNLEAGNITNDGIPIQFIRIKRKKSSDINWEIMCEMKYDKNEINYDLKDYYIKAYENMEYTLCGVTQDVESTGIKKSILVQYDALFLTGKDENNTLYNYPLRFDLSMGDVILNEAKTFQQPLFSPYPILQLGVTKYQSGSLNVTLVSPSTENAFGDINIQAENRYRETFENFIYLGRPLLIRYHSLYLLGVISQPKKKPKSDDGAYGIWTYNFTFTELNSTNLDNLKKYGLTYDVLRENNKT